jgi:hypothetical protein
MLDLNLSPSENEAIRQQRQRDRATRLEARARRLLAAAPYLHDPGLSPADNAERERRHLDRLRAQAAAVVDNPLASEFLPRDNELWAQLRATPEDFVHDSFQSADVEDGVREVTAELHATGEWATYAYCFTSPKFDMATASAWLSAKGIMPAKLDPAKDTTYRQITATAATGQYPNSTIIPGGRATVSPPSATF